MYRVRCRWFANDFFAQFSKDCRPAQEFVLLIIEKHNGFILFYLCVDHEDLARRTDEKKSTLSDAPIYIMGSKMPSV
jgi:hypothetical protein